jgi:hypothetical protein
MASRARVDRDGGCLSPGLEVSTRTAVGSIGTGEQLQSDVHVIRRAIPIGPATLAMARDAVAGVAGTVDSGVLSQAQLLVSELASHAVRLPRGDRDGVLDLAIWLTPKYLRVQVTADYARPRRGQRAPSDPIPDWGLQLVTELSDRWGMRHDTRTTLWLELDL